MSSTTSTISTATTSAALATRKTPRRRRRHRTVATVLKAFAAGRTPPSTTATPAPSNRWVAPITRDYALDPAYHLRMVR